MNAKLSDEDRLRIERFYGGPERGERAIAAFRAGGSEAELFIKELGDPEFWENNGTRRFIFNTALRLREGGGR